MAPDEVGHPALARVGLPLLRLAHGATPEGRDAAIRRALTDAHEAMLAA